MNEELSAFALDYRLPYYLCQNDPMSLQKIYPNHHTSSQDLVFVYPDKLQIPSRYFFYPVFYILLLFFHFVYLGSGLFLTLSFYDQQLSVKLLFNKVFGASYFEVTVNFI